jgi:membrane-bound serine protease (ClpP class)
MRAALAAVIAVAGLLVGAPSAWAADGGGQVDVIPFTTAVNPVSANYVVHSLQQAQQDGAAAAIIQVDTPGGLDTSMRQVIRAMTSSSVPVVVYVAPTGARAGSAGVFITMASDVAAMAPGTNIGAAHPVGLGGTAGQPSAAGQPTGAAQGAQAASPQSDADVEATKVLNDSVAYIRSLAESHGRNADWAEQAVRQSVSVTNQQALQQHIVELQANSLPDLLNQLDGRVITRADGATFTLHTAGASVKQLPMSPFEDLLSYIADPTLAYVLMLVGVYGVIFELSTPGAILPGVLGGLALILGLLSLGTLPVNYAGLALMGFAFILFVADIKLPTHGILTAGGVISFLLGSLALFNTGQSGLAISLPLIAGVTAATNLFFAIIVRLGVRARRAPSTTGTGQVLGHIGQAQTDLTPEGRVLVNGEGWRARADAPVAAGTRIEVLAVDGFTLQVRPVQQHNLNLTTAAASERS